MTNVPQGVTRRRFLGAVSTTAAAAAGRLRRGFARASGAKKQHKTILSFSCDDTGPGTGGAGAFRTFLDY